MRAPIRRGVFFARLRACGLLGPALPETAVQGLTGLLDAWERLGWPEDLRFVAYTMATAWHECRLDLTVREAGRGRGRPYGRAVGGRVYYGRGACQLTWIDNYRRFGRLLGLDLVADPDLALAPAVSAEILVLGCARGLFRAGHTLGRYFGPAVDDPVRARAIVNGDGARNGAAIARDHRAFLACLRAAAADPPPAPGPAAQDAAVRGPAVHDPTFRAPAGARPTDPAAPAAPARASWWGRWIAPLFAKESP